MHTPTEHHIAQLNNLQLVCSTQQLRSDNSIIYNTKLDMQEDKSGKLVKQDVTFTS